LLFAVNLLNFYDRQILGTVTEPIRREWGFTDTQLGWLGTAFILLYAMVGVPLGRLADRSSRKYLLAGGLFVWSLLTALSSAAAGFWSLFATRLGIGIGEAACAPAAASLIGDLYPAGHRARAMSIFMLGLPLGTAMSFVLSGAVAYAWGWRAAFLVVGIPGCFLALLTVFILREPARGASEAAAIGERRRAGSPYLVVLGIPTLWWLIISGALHNFNMYAIAQFLPAFLIRTHGLNLRQAGFVSGVIIGIAGALGMCFGGRLADRFDAVRPGGRLLLGSFCVLGAVPLKLIALGLPAGKPYLFLFWMLLGCMLMYVYYSSVYAAIQNVVEPSLRGTAMAVYFLGMYALGGSLGPVVTGRLSDFFAHRVQNAVQLGSPITEAAKAIGLHQAMYAIPTLECLVSLVLFAASRTYIRDRQKMHAWMESLSSAADPERPELPARAPAAR